MDKLKELQELIKTTEKNGYHRCSCCNAVSNQAIATEPEDYKPNMSFMKDPKNPMFDICVDCYEEINEVRQEFEYMDDEDEV